MLTGAIARLKAGGIRRLESFSESDYLQALRFHGKLGFVHEGTPPDFYERAGEPHYVDE